ncbi:MAG TPA: hypothetical protein VM782_21055, partial [Stellaceae bacterium]|nr:hypothetical protein [Stellaceae bacterium]
SEAQAAAGDLVCWPGAGTAGHIGIVLAPGKMVSALNPQLGTLVSPITGYGPLGVPQVYRRLTGITPGGVLAAAQPGGGGNTTAALLLGAAVVAAMLGTVLALTALAALGATAGAGWLAARAAR